MPKVKTVVAVLDCFCLWCGRHWKTVVGGPGIVRCPKCHKDTEQKELFKLKGNKQGGKAICQST